MEAEEAQGVLIHVEPHPIEAAARQAKRCTAELLAERDPDTYNDVVKRLAANDSIRQIKRDFGLGTDTVMAIRRREWKEVGTLKAVIADTLLHGAAVGAEVAAALVAECDDPVAAAMATKMMAETSNLMRGQATSINATVVVNVDAAAAARRLEEKALEMGLGGGENLALGDAVRVVLPGVLVGGISPTMDSESVGSVVQSIDCESVVIPCHGGCHEDSVERVSEAQASPENFEGGGGDARPRAPDGV